jgi:hypothetical protein
MGLDEERGHQPHQLSNLVFCTSGAFPEFGIQFCDFVNGEFDLIYKSVMTRLTMMGFTLSALEKPSKVRYYVLLDQTPRRANPNRPDDTGMPASILDQSSKVLAFDVGCILQLDGSIGHICNCRMPEKGKTE